MYIYIYIWQNCRECFRHCCRIWKLHNEFHKEKENALPSSIQIPFFWINFHDFVFFFFFFGSLRWCLSFWFPIPKTKRHRWKECFWSLGFRRYYFPGTKTEEPRKNTLCAILVLRTSTSISLVTFVPHHFIQKKIKSLKLQVLISFLVLGTLPTSNNYHVYIWYPPSKIDQNHLGKDNVFRPGKCLSGRSQQRWPIQKRMSWRRCNGPMGLRRNRAELSCALPCHQSAQQKWSSYFYHPRISFSMATYSFSVNQTNFRPTQIWKDDPPLGAEVLLFGRH